MMAKPSICAVSLVSDNVHARESNSLSPSSLGRTDQFSFVENGPKSVALTTVIWLQQALMLTRCNMKHFGDQLLTTFFAYFILFYRQHFYD